MVGETLVETFGPFLIPAALFVVGFVAYGVLVALTRLGILPMDQSEPGDSGGND